MNIKLKKHTWTAKTRKVTNKKYEKLTTEF